MGHRLHTAVVYKVEYGQNASFNWAQEHINNIIETLAEGDIFSEGEDLDYANTLQAHRGTLLANVDKIKTPDENWANQEVLEEQIENMLNDDTCNIDRDYLYQQLKWHINASDADCDYVHFAWF